MKTRLIIEDRTWEYRLHAAPQEPGKYFVKLCALDGGKVRPAVATGPFRTLDEIQENAPRLYLQLVAMRESAAAGGAFGDALREVTTNHTAEHVQS